MANDNTAKFEELLRGNEDIQAKLQELVQAYDGDKEDAKAFFDATLGKLAEEHGLPFTYEEGAEYQIGGRNLSDEELDAVAGGHVCYIIGASKGAEHACHYVGVSFGTRWYGE